jgi:hypothetical protein
MKERIRTPKIKAAMTAMMTFCTVSDRMKKTCGSILSIPLPGSPVRMT